MSTPNLDALFCSVDDFCKNFLPLWHRQQLGTGSKRPHRPRCLTLSEQMTIVIAFHQSHYRTFKQFYVEHVCVYWRDAFPPLPSDQRFVEWMPSLLIPLWVYLKTLFGTCTGISFIDSTSLGVCHPRRIHRHRVFAVLAARGKTSVGWFYGFKLHFERLWQHLRAALAWQSFETLEALRQKLQAVLSQMTAAVIRSLTGWSFITQPLLDLSSN